MRISCNIYLKRLYASSKDIEKVNCKKNEYVKSLIIPGLISNKTAQNLWYIIEIYTIRIYRYVQGNHLSCPEIG